MQQLHIHNSHGRTAYVHHAAGIFYVTLWSQAEGEEILADEFLYDGPVFGSDYCAAYQMAKGCAASATEYGEDVLFCHFY